MMGLRLPKVATTFCRHFHRVAFVMQPVVTVAFAARTVGKVALVAPTVSTVALLTPIGTMTLAARPL
jgi:hypothetical protein